MAEIVGWALIAIAWLAFCVGIGFGTAAALNRIL